MSEKTKTINVGITKVIYTPAWDKEIEAARVSSIKDLAPIPFCDNHGIFKATDRSVGGFWFVKPEKVEAGHDDPILAWAEKELEDKNEVIFNFQGKYFHVFLRGDGDYDVNMFNKATDLACGEDCDDGGTCEGDWHDAIYFMLEPPKHKAAAIYVNRAEGRIDENNRQKLCVGENLWEEANAQLTQWGTTVNGGYDKVDFHIIFEDGSEYTGTYDLRKHEQGNIGAHVKSHLAFNSGRSKGLSSMSDEQYADFLAHYKSDEAGDLLDKYAFG